MGLGILTPINFPYGAELLGGFLAAGQGKSVFLDPTNGNDGNDGFSLQTAKKTLDGANGAYPLLTAGQNDTLYYLAGTSGLTLSAGFVWDKNYTRFIGIAAPGLVAQRSRIFMTPTNTDTVMFTVSASGCVFKNLYIFHGVASALAKVCVKVTGQRNYFEDVHAAGMGDATMDVAGAASLWISGGAENRFKHCAIGLDTVGCGANSTELLFDTAATRNLFEDCLLYRYITNAGHATVTVTGGAGIDRWQIFKDCLFETDSENQAVQQTSVFLLPAGIVQGKIILKNCMMLTDGASGAGDWDSNNRGILWNDKVAPAATAAGGIATKQ